MDVQIFNNNINFFLSEYGIHAKDFIVSSIPLNAYSQTMEGRSGNIDYGADYGVRPISVPFYFQSHDLHDFPLLRDKLFELVGSLEPFYIRELRRVVPQAYEFVGIDEVPKEKPGTDNIPVGGKVYEVRITNAFDIEQTVNMGEGVLEFETVGLPFAKSIGTSMDIDDKGVHATDAFWGFGMGLISDDEALKYRHDAVAGTRFRIFNAGNILEHHPFECELKMTIKNVKGSAEMFQITNLTNGSRTRVRVPLKESDVVVYDGANVTKNELNILRDTSKLFVTLSPGWNNFMIYFCDSATVEFDFPFYYL